MFKEDNGLKKLIVGSRGSRLAVIQSELMMKRMEEVYPDIRTELVTMKTTGDKILDKTLDQIGGKGLFVRELDEALLSGVCDMTVHSLKDLPQMTDERIPLTAFSEREDARDVLALPEGASGIDLSKPIGTSSLRRSIQIKELYPGAETAPIRGNVETRLRKLDEGQYSALIMAAAGLKRLGLQHRISRFFEPDEMIPASCQGILGIQARADDEEVREMIATALNCREAELCAAAERAFVRAIGADCGSPDTAYSWMENGEMHLIGFRYETSCGRISRENLSGRADEPAEAAELGRKLAERLLGNKE